MSVVAVAAAVLALAVYPVVERYAGSGVEHDQAAQRGAAADGEAHASLQYDVDGIIAAHLMGRPPADDEPADVAQAPETRLQLRLLGMIASANDQYARALIGVNSREVGAYGVGESVEGTDASIHSVEPRRVLLNRNGAVESLHLKTPELINDTPSTRTADPADSRDVPDSQDEGMEPETSHLPDSAGQAPSPAVDDVDNEIPYTGIRETAGKRSNLPF